MTNDEDYSNSIVQRLLEVAQPERGPLLEDLCGDDDELRSRVEALLTEYGEAEAFVEKLGERLLTEPIIAATSPPLVDPYGLAGSQVGRFRVEDCIGGGGMGLVYRAMDSELKRTVVLKFLPPEVSRDVAANERFRREAIAASRLDHASIATIHDIGTDDVGRLFIAMAYYDGETLREKMASSSIETDDAIRYATEIARGLSHAHAHGVVHRDIKPANVMITAAGEVKILDFGLAQMGDVSGPRPYAPMGTLAYMSPEQARGDDVDARTDLWSLGVVLYEMLAGKRPFDGRFEPAVINLILNEEPADIGAIRPDVPEGILETVRDCLAKDREKRPASAEDVVSRLARHPDSDERAGFVATARRAASSPQQKRMRIAMGVAGAAVAVIVALLWPRAIKTTQTDSFEPPVWTKDANNPVMSGGAVGSWDRHVFGPQVLYNSDSSRFEMWFSASSGFEHNKGRPYSIGFAHSRDGVSWTKRAEPVLEADPNAWDEWTVEGHSVIREDGIYKMWYHGEDDDMGGIGYATSTDGIRWSKYSGNPIVKPGPAAWDGRSIGYAVVARQVTDEYQMWYFGVPTDMATLNVGYAISDDGISWSKADGVNPVLKAGPPGNWDDFYVIGSSVIRYDHAYHLFYAATQKSGVARSIGWARSEDGIDWTKWNDPKTSGTLFTHSDPVLSPSESPDWDSDFVEGASVVHLGDTLHMWYAGRSATSPWHIGHATALASNSSTTNQAASLAFRRGMEPYLWEAKAFYFESSSSLDEDFARAHLMRVLSYAVQYWEQQVPRVGLQTLRERAVGAAERVATLSPGSENSELAHGYLTYFIEEDYESALDHFRTAVSLRPSDSYALEAQGFVQGQLGMFEEAIAAATRAFGLDPQRGSLAFQIAWMHFGMGDYEEAARWLDRAIMIDGRSSTAYYYQGVFMERMGDTEQAREILLSLPPADRSSWRDLRSIVCVHFRERNFDAILESIEAFADINRNPNLRNQLYLAYVRAVATAHGTQDAAAAALAWHDLLNMARNLGNLYRPLVSMHAYAGLSKADSLLMAVTELLNRLYGRPWLSSISSTLEPNAPWAQDYPSALFEAAVALTRGGLHAEALNRLEELSELRFRSSYSHPAVLDYVYFDPLRDDPRFQALVENWERKK